MAIGSYVGSNKRLLAAIFFHVKHRKREPEGGHGQLESCNRSLRPKVALANNNYLAPLLFPNFVQNTSFSIVLKFGTKLSVRLEDISKLLNLFVHVSISSNLPAI